MVSCPKCNKELSDEFDKCPHCGYELESDSETNQEWRLIASFPDQPTAELAKEALINSDIPAVLISKAGFFGSAGLTMNPLYNSEQNAYELSVPQLRYDDALELLNSVLGDSWRRC